MEYVNNPVHVRYKIVKYIQVTDSRSYDPDFRFLNNLPYTPIL